MFPVYGGMHSYPDQRGPVPSTQYYYPGWEAVPPQMKEDSASSCHAREPGPHNYGFPAPMPSYNCCAHSQYPSYHSFRPPCPHFQPQVPQPTFGHCCGSYPAYQQPFPVSHVPPPHYTMELPRYESDKSVPKDGHCCGCPNHTCNTKGRTNVKIEEHEPHAEAEKSESLVPAGVNNFPYPVMWIPPGYITNKEQPRRVVENQTNEQQVMPSANKYSVQPRLPQTEVEEHQGSPRVRKSNQSMQTAERDPNVRYGWFPLDINSIRQLMESGHGSKSHDQEEISADERDGLEKKEPNKSFSYPIIWMPYDGQREQNVKRRLEEQKDDSTPSKVSPSAFKVVPKLEQPDGPGEKEKTAAGDAGSVVNTEAKERPRKVKTIPVKQLGESVPKSSKNDGKNAEVRTPAESLDKVSREPDTNGSSIQSSVPARKSKLPPICLRVDPLKKKCSNGSSRSPSLPGGQKSQLHDDTNASTKIKEQHPKKEAKVSEPLEGASNEKKIEVSQAESHEKSGSSTQQHEVKAERKVVQEADDNKFIDSDLPADFAPEPQGQEESKPQVLNKTVRKTMSEMDAAVKIQSAYRGYEVRRWEPLKKLRQIHKVSDEATEVKRHIEDLESRANVDNKEKAAIGETIMSLLLKLDTVQGLHPTIRNIRRSVANDLNILLEKLDSAVGKMSGPAVHHGPSAGVEEPLIASGLDECTEGSVDELSGKVYSLDETFDSSKGPEAHKDVLSVVERAADEMKEAEVDKSEMVPADSLDSSEPSVDAGAVENTTLQANLVSGNEGQEAHLLAEQPGETFDQVENEISRMDWECDLGTAKTAVTEDQEAVLLAELPHDAVEEVENEVSRMDWECDLGTARVTSFSEQPNEDAASASQMEKAEHEQNVLTELPQAVINDNEEGTCGTEISGTLNKSPDTDQFIEKPEIEYENSVSTNHEDHIVVEVPSEKIVSGEESESTYSPRDMEVPVTEPGDHELQERFVEEVSSVEPEFQVKTLVDVPVKVDDDEGLEASDSKSSIITESQWNPKSHDQDASELLAGDHEKAAEVHAAAGCNVTGELIGSEDVKQTVKSAPDVMQSDVKQFKDEDETSTLSSEGQGSEYGEQIERKMIQENEKLKDMLEKLLASGKEQQDVISSLTGKVKDLEKQLARKKIKSTRRPKLVVSRSPCSKSPNGFRRQRPMGTAS